MEIFAISAAKSGILVTSFSSNHENICSRNPAAIQHTFKLILDTIYRMRQKVYPTNFLQYLKISKRNFTDILGILCAHNSIITIRLAYSVFKVINITLMPRSDFSVLKLGLHRSMSENRMKNRLKNNCLDFIAKNVASKFTTIEPLWIPCLGNC